MFRKMVQDLMDRKEIEFLNKREQSINVITSTTYLGDPSPNGRRPITIFHDNLPVKEETSEALKPVLVIEVVITVSRSTWNSKNQKGVATNLFC